MPAAHPEGHQGRRHGERQDEADHREGDPAAIDRRDPAAAEAVGEPGRVVAGRGCLVLGHVDRQRGQVHLVAEHPLLPEQRLQLRLASGQLARAYGFTDLDGSRPDIWRYIEEVREAGRQADLEDYR